MAKRPIYRHVIHIPRSRFAEFHRYVNAKFDKNYPETTIRCMLNEEARPGPIPDEIRNIALTLFDGYRYRQPYFKD